MNHAKGGLGARAALLALPLWLMAAGGGAGAQEPLTRPERTGWLETSRYADVLEFLDAVEMLDGRDGERVLHRTTFGYSLEGRPLPLMVVGAGLQDGAPATVLGTGRARVLVFANIHAGEVEGKEAAQMLLRELASGRHAGWLDSLVLLVAPIYNADGNERVSVLNRYRQNGPHGGVGERSNAQGLDLNRDHMKLRSPEARSLVGLMAAYDPHVVIDLHTTNGTRHAYHLTYSPPLHPDTDPRIVALLRSEWLPEVTRRLRDDEGWETYYYGNAYAPAGGERGWYTFDYRPRFSNNYVGLRNRIGILSEAYSYASFEDRIAATLAFVRANVDFAHRRAGELVRLVESADSRDLRGHRIPLRADFERGPEVEILMGAAEERLDRFSGRRYLARLEVTSPERMREYGTFAGTETERVPRAYYVPGELSAVVDLLAFHGVAFNLIDSPRRVRGETFVVDSTRQAEREFEGHREREVFGRWTPDDLELAPGTLEVPMDQPLARLIYHLLEPRAADGALNWNLLDQALEADPGIYPILRRP